MRFHFLLEGETLSGDRVKQERRVIDLPDLDALVAHAATLPRPSFKDGTVFLKWFLVYYGDRNYTERNPEIPLSN